MRKTRWPGEVCCIRRTIGRNDLGRLCEEELFGMSHGPIDYVFAWIPYGKTPTRIARVLRRCGWEYCHCEHAWRMAQNADPKMIARWLLNYGGPGPANPPQFNKCMEETP